MSKGKDFWCIVSVDYNKDQAFILAQSDDCRNCDLLEGNALEDSVECGEFIAKADPGLYRVKLHPWSCEAYDGYQDSGVDIDAHEQIVKFPPLA